MNVLVVSPGFPEIMAGFPRGLARLGARVFGVGDQPEDAVLRPVAEALAAYLKVDNLWDEDAVIERVLGEASRFGIRFDRVECLWEPAQMLAARLRHVLGVPGLTVEQAIAFRDKGRMKQVLDAAGIRTPWHTRARSFDDVRQAAGRVGFPLIVKPIAGAGSVDTHRVDDPSGLEAVLPSLRHVAEVSVEEFIEGEEFTFDTISAAGDILYENVAWYRTHPMEEKKHEWVSPSAICLREIDDAGLEDGRRMGRRVLAALGFRTGFTHMEWFRKPSGEVVFGEIAARPPGARLVDVMNFASDIDVYSGWAEAVLHGSFSQPIERRYNAALISKRARGHGRIRHVEGLDRLAREFGPHLVVADVLPDGAPRRDWRQSSVGDGFFVVRHPDFDTTLRMVERIGHEVHIWAD